MPSFSTKKEPEKPLPVETAPQQPQESAEETPLVPTITHQICKNCEKDLPISEYYPQQTKTGYGTICKACVRKKREQKEELIRKSNDEDKIEFVTEKIAMLTIAPRQEGDWAGRDRIIRMCRARYDLNYDAAEKIVNEAVKRLFDERPDNPPRIERRLLLQRLNRMSEIIFKSLEKSHVITEYEIFSVRDPATGDIKKDPAGKPLIYKVPKKMKKVKGAETSLIRNYIEIETLRIKVCGLDKAGERDSLIGELMEQFHQSAVKGSHLVFDKKGGSVAKQIRESNVPVAELIDQHQHRLKAIEATIDEPSTDQDNARR